MRRWKNPLYADILDRWLAEHRVGIMESTAYDYERANLKIKNYFNNVRVKDITAQMIYDFMNYLKENNISYTSTRTYGKVIRMSLGYAVKCGYIYYNPANDVKIHTKKRTEISPFTEEEFYLLMDTKGPEWVKSGIMIAFRTGMRPGEIYALKWSDINLEQHYISVQRSISRACSSTKETKTPSSARRIDIDSKLVSYLSELKKTANNAYVFPGSGKREYKVPWNISKELKRMCENVGIPPRNFYSLRHTHASVLLSHVVHPKIVQERLGHSDCKITMNVYSHILPTIQGTAVNVMENI